MTNSLLTNDLQNSSLDKPFEDINLLYFNHNDDSPQIPQQFYSVFGRVCAYPNIF